MTLLFRVWLLRKVAHLIRLFGFPLPLFMKRIASVASLTVILVTTLSQSALAADSGFIDMDPGDFGYDAALYLQKRNIMSGYDNGTFRPDNLVTRSEAMKIIAFPLISTKDESNGTTSTDFIDVENNAWYVPYLNWAVKNFHPKA